MVQYGYGSMFAVLYAALAGKSKINGVAKGTAFGLAVWGLSYMGVLPALKVRSQAQQMTKNRNQMMLALHVIWGASLGFAEEKMRSSGKAMFDGKLKKRGAE